MRRTLPGRNRPSRPNRSERSTAEVLATLSLPVDPDLLRGPDFGRRRFLQASGVAGIAAVLRAGWPRPRPPPPPLRPDEGVVVLVTMAGGNDGLNTFIPVHEGAYHDARHNLAISPSEAIPMTAQRSLHPRLGHLKTVWDRGDLAVIEGVGHNGRHPEPLRVDGPDHGRQRPRPARQQRLAGAGPRRPPLRSAGRDLDRLDRAPAGPGSTAPGQRRAPPGPDDIRQIDPTNPVSVLQYDAIRALAGGPSGPRPAR